MWHRIDDPDNPPPKDGTWIDLWREIGSSSYGSPRVTARWDDEISAWVWPDDVFDPWTQRGRNRAERMIANEENFFDRSPTHWMPLPPPPAEDTP